MCATVSASRHAGTLEMRPCFLPTRVAAHRAAPGREENPMAGSVKASASESMYLDTRIPEGYVVVCARAGEEHSFLVHRLGVAVECPTSGRTALSAKLIDDYYARTQSLLQLAYGSDSTAGGCQLHDKVSEEA